MDFKMFYLDLIYNSQSKINCYVWITTEMLLAQPQRVPDDWLPRYGECSFSNETRYKPLGAGCCPLEFSSPWYSRKEEFRVQQELKANMRSTVL